MARKTIDYTVVDEGRDKGKLFLLTEMPASHAESWAMRAILALMAGGVDLPEGFERLGMAGMAELGIKALSRLKWEDAEPLLTEMWQCVQIIPDPGKPQIVRRLIEEDIEEIATRINLRMEIWKLHVDFSKAAAPLNSAGSRVPARKKP
jgi:hypothetical protein